MPQAVSSRYARALADAVLDPKSGLDAGAAAAQLRSMGEVIRENADLRNVLLSPAVSATRKRAVVARLAESLRLAKLVRNFFYVLIDRRRIDLIDDITQAFEAEVDSRLGIARAVVTSAAPLTEKEREAMLAALGRLTGRQVRADYAVDPALIGGAVTRIGSTIYDGSVRGRLEALRAQLVSE